MSENNTRSTTIQILEAFGKAYITFCVTYVTLSAIFMAGYNSYRVFVKH